MKPSRASSFLVISLILVGIFVVSAPVAAGSALAPGGTFIDDDGNPHEGSIEAIFAAGLTKGCSQDGPRFCPSAPVTRAEMAAFLVRAVGLEPSAEHQFLFPDVPPGSWYAPFVERLVVADVVNGYPDGLFRPNKAITRGEMAGLLVRGFDHIDASVGVGSFSDVPEDAWYAPAIEGLLDAGITKGCATAPLRFCPSDPVLRDQMATFIMRAMGLQPVYPPPRYDGPALATLHVDNRHPAASNSNPGTIDKPLAAIQAAVDRSKAARSGGEGIRIIVHPGTYRESIAIGYAGANPPPLFLEAAKPGEAIVSGADNFKSWSFDPTSGAHVHAWSHDWGSAPGVAPIVGRREIVVVNGDRLVQVVAKGDLAPGRFFVDEPGNRIYAWPSAGSISAAEVAVRARTLTLDGASNTTVRGLVFRHAASPFDSSSVGVFNGGNNTLDGNTITQNSWNGVGVATTQGVTFNGNLITHNGGGGMSIFKSPSLQLNSNTTSHNNWRGAAGGYTGWSIAAVKMVGVHDAEVANHTSVGNATRGFWVDYDIRRISIRDSVFSNNLTDGLFVEAAPGPVTVIGTTLSGNGRYGLLLSNVQATSIQEATMCSNGKSAIRIDTDPGGRTVDSLWLPAARDLDLLGSTLGASERLIDSNVPSDQWQQFVQTLRSDNNMWIPTDANTAFVFLGQKHDLSAWRAATGQDAASSIGLSGCG